MNILGMIVDRGVQFLGRIFILSFTPFPHAIRLHSSLSPAFRLARRSSTMKKQKAIKNCLQSEPTLADDVSLAPVSKQLREEHISQIVSENSWKIMTIEQKKKEESKPIYLVRYE